MVELLKKALTVLPDDEELQREYDTWKSRIPVSLTSLKTFSSVGGVYARNNVEMDNYENTYNPNIIASSSGSVEYYLDGKYKFLTGVIFVRHSGRGKAGVSTVSIYGDDVLLGSYDFSNKSKPVEIKVDITGVDFLKIKFTGGYVGIGNPCVGW